MEHILKSVAILKFKIGHLHIAIVYANLVKDRATIVLCENSFCRNLKTNKIKHIKAYILRKEMSEGIYLNSQIFGKKIHF